MQHGAAQCEVLGEELLLELEEHVRLSEDGGIVSPEPSC